MNVGENYMGSIIYPNFLGAESRLPYYPAGVGINHVQEQIIRPWGYHQYQWIQCRSGMGELFIGDKRYVIKENQGFILFPHFPNTDEPHEYRALGSEWITDWVIFNGDEIPVFFDKTMNISGSRMLYISSPSQIRRKIEALLNASQNLPAESNRCSIITYEILIDIMTLTSEKENNSSDTKQKRIEPVINYINENYDKVITLSDLADIAGLTPQYLCSLFKSITSKTIFEYICLTKIQKSKEILLKSPNLMVKTVAEMSGFNDESYFCVVFKRQEKMSPLEFRRLHLGV